MNITKALTIATALVLTAPAAKEIPDDPEYTAVRNDVFEKLNVSDINLPICEKSLEEAQIELGEAQANINSLRDTARRLQERVHGLEQMLQYQQQDFVGQMGRGWEEVDGTVGIIAGWAVGTAQCVGLAYVFNQPGFRQ